MIQTYAPTHGQSYTNNEADQVVAGIANDYANGTLSETEARGQIAEVLFATGIHRQEASRAPGVPSDQRGELADRLMEIVVRKLLQSGQDAYYDITLARTASACGWARKLIQASLQSEKRNLRRSHARSWGEHAPVMLDMTLEWSDIESTVDRDSDPALTRDTPVGLAQENAVVQFLRRSKRMSEAEKYHHAALHLARIIGVPMATRPLLASTRNRLLPLLSSDPTLASRTLWHHAQSRWPEDFSGLRSQEITPEAAKLSLPLWRDYSLDEVDLLLQRGAAPVHALAMAATSPRPRPAKSAVTEYVNAVSAQAIGKTARRGWRQLAVALAESWLASECEPVARSTFLSPEARRQVEVAHLIARRCLDDLIAQAIEHKTAPLGTSRRAVLTRLSRLAEDTFAWSVLGEDLDEDAA